MTNLKTSKRNRNHKKIRARIGGTDVRPRLAVFKSNTAIYAQLIDDVLGVTLASATDSDATKVGTDIGQTALKLGVKEVVFDRGGFIYTGKVKVLAEAARKTGLKF